MSRTAYDIACSALGDLYDVQKAFSNIRVIFTVMLRNFPEDHTAHALAKLGVLEVDDWADTVCQWAECMDSELDDPCLDIEAQAYLDKFERRVKLQAGALDAQGGMQ